MTLHDRMNPDKLFQLFYRAGFLPSFLENVILQKYRNQFWEFSQKIAKQTQIVSHEMYM